MSSDTCRFRIEREIVRQTTHWQHPIDRSCLMRTHYAAVTVLLGVSLFGSDARLSPRFQTVYIVEMGNGLDQYLASRLTATRALWVVLEPSSADAVLTDTLDDSFWSWLSRTYPQHAGTPGGPGSAFRRDTLPPMKRRGTVFLVDPRNRLVLWSAYDLPKNASPDELNRTATRITTNLKTAFGKK